jgi:thioredoxin-related protein
VPRRSFRLGSVMAADAMSFRVIGFEVRRRSSSGDAKYKEVQQKLQFKSTPHFILLTAKGERVREWTGVVDEKVLKTSIDDLLKGQ